MLTDIEANEGIDRYHTIKRSLLRKEAGEQYRLIEQYDNPEVREKEQGSKKLFK
jgi:hypothetical protein